jgi:hypothetical protein
VATKVWELFYLAGTEPDLLDDALYLEVRAMTGKNSRFDAELFGGSWHELIRSPRLIRSKKTVLGLGRDYAWNQWARIQDVVDEGGRVRRGDADRARFLQLAAQKRGNDALDARCGVALLERSAGARRVVPIRQQQGLDLGLAAPAPANERGANPAPSS